MKLKNYISKEDFKRAYSQCFKLAFLAKSKENFFKVVEWTNNKLISPIDRTVRHEIEEEKYDTAEPSINLFLTYLNSSLNNKIQEQLNNQIFISETEINQFKKEFESFWYDDYENDYDKDSEVTESIIDGLEVGDKAREYFDLISLKQNKNTLDLAVFNFKDAKNNFDELVNNGNFDKYTYIYEPAFSYDNEHLKTRCDVLKNNGNRHVEIFEVKATSHAKSEHFFDLLYQKFVLEKNNFIVDDVHLVILNSKYLLGNKTLLEDSLGAVAKEKYKNYIFENGEPSFSKFGQNLEQVLSEQKDYIQNVDLDLELLFKVDDFSSNSKSKVPNKRPTFKAIMPFFETEYPVNQLLETLDKFFSEGDEYILKYFKNNCCNNLKDLKSLYKGPKFYPNKEDFILKNFNDENYCKHFCEWFDKNEFTYFDMGLRNNSKAIKFAKKTGSVYVKDLKSLSDLPLVAKGKSIYDDKTLKHIFNTTLNYIKNKKINPVMEGIEKELTAFLNLYKNYPVYHYDFETMKTAIPIFYGTCSYQQIPFQYSIDVMVDKNWFERVDDDSSKVMPHYEYIADEEFNPQLSFAINFIRDCFKHGPGLYVVYNESFEKSVLKKLAYLYPNLAEPIYYIVNNTIDLMGFFGGIKEEKRLVDSKNNAITLPRFAIYHPQFRGSYSIKVTQPVLYPRLSYKDLTINKGDKTSYAFRQYKTNMIKKEIYETTLKPDMLKYCNRDTMAMVVLLKTIIDVAEGKILNE